jgi:tRNA threonylcarbamoyladenosine biosynthesis protein TsaE
LCSFAVVSATEAQTQEIGRILGQVLQSPALILLQGELGAGKTVLARGIARGLGVEMQIPITSPTFTLMNHYSARLELYHFDLYRLSDPDELIELGFDDYAHGSGVALVEWPEKLERNHVNGLWVSLQRLDENQRELVFVARGAESEKLVIELKDALGSAFSRRDRDPWKATISQ